MRLGKRERGKKSYPIKNPFLPLVFFLQISPLGKYDAAFMFVWGSSFISDMPLYFVFPLHLILVSFHSSYVSLYFNNNNNNNLYSAKFPLVRCALQLLLIKVLSK